jgi:hypothetical protein
MYQVKKYLPNDVANIVFDHIMPDWRIQFSKVMQALESRYERMIEYYSRIRVVFQYTQTNPAAPQIGRKAQKKLLKSRVRSTPCAVTKKKSHWRRRMRRRRRRRRRMRRRTRS